MPPRVQIDAARTTYQTSERGSSRDGENGGHTIMVMGQGALASRIKRRGSILNEVNLRPTLTLYPNGSPGLAEILEQHGKPSSPNGEGLPLSPTANITPYLHQPVNVKTIVNDTPQKDSESPPKPDRMFGCQEVPHLTFVADEKGNERRLG